MSVSTNDTHVCNFYLQSFETVKFIFGNTVSPLPHRDYAEVYTLDEYCLQEFIISSSILNSYYTHYHHFKVISLYFLQHVAKPVNFNDTF